MAEVTKCGSRELFLELQEKTLRVLRERGEQGTSHTRALNNAEVITIRRDGKRYIFSWPNTQEESAYSYFHFRWNDRLAKWVRDHIIFPGRQIKRRKFSERRLRRAEKRARQDKARRLDLGQLSQEICTPGLPPHAA